MKKILKKSDSTLKRRLNLSMINLPPKQFSEFVKEQENKNNVSAQVEKKKINLISRQNSL